MITLTKEQALITLACLEHAIYEEDENDNTLRNKLIYNSDDVAWELAEQLDIDLNYQYVDIHTLEVKDNRDS